MLMLQPQHASMFALSEHAIMLALQPQDVATEEPQHAGLFTYSYKINAVHISM